MKKELSLWNFIFIHYFNPHYHFPFISSSETCVIMNVVILLIFVLALLFLLVYYCKTSNASMLISNVVNKSSEATNFSPTYYDIYDKSTEGNCDRLIHIMPFDWWIWSNRNRVYILNSQSGYDCPTNMSVGIEVKFNSEDLNVSCLNLQTAQIFQFYMDMEPVRVFFNLNNITSFTIADSLNFLFTKYLTLLDDENVNVADSENISASIKSTLTMSGASIKNSNLYRVNKSKLTSSEKRKLANMLSSKTLNLHI